MNEHPCPEYEGVSEYGGPCWTCQGDPDHCPMTETMVDLGGGMVVRLSELMDDE